MRKTKIVCTIGPATDRENVLRQLMEKGVDVVRFNFSHGSYEEHEKRMKEVKAERERVDRPVAIMLDTKGPEIRIGTLKEGKVHLKEGDKLTLTANPIEGTKECISITYKDLYHDVVPDSRILIDDGLIETKVLEIKDGDIICEVLNDGELSDRKGINVPGCHLTMPYLSEKDKADILFGIKMDVDFIAASFVRTKEDVIQIRELLKENGGENIHIISKIENAQGVENIDEIIEVSEGIMVARGDMGVEIPGEEVPVIQKMIIRKVYEAGKQVITATQMLDSMMHNPRPTRAETADVANAIFDGTSAIMLSGETAAGKYPVESLEMMVKIATRTEQEIDYRKRFFQTERRANPDITDAICHATCTTAHDLNARAIVTVTKTGYSARMISRYRPACDVIGCTIEAKVSRQLNMSWGVQPLVLKEEQDVFELFDNAIRKAKEHELLKEQDVTVITSGVPIGKSGTTNMIKVQVVS